MSLQEFIPLPEREKKGKGDLAIMRTGGGACAAYQVGLVRGIARHFPATRFQIITGVSAGAINAIFLAAKEGSLPEKVGDLSDLWGTLQYDHVFHPNYSTLLPFRGSLRRLLPRRIPGYRPHGIFNATPLAAILRRIIRRNLRRGVLKAVSLLALDDSSGQCVRWVQGALHRSFRRSEPARQPVELTVEHVLASAALPRGRHRHRGSWLGQPAADDQRFLPRSMKTFTRAVGGYDMESSDFLSLVMFEPNYLQLLIEIGEEDVESRLDDLAEFLGQTALADVAMA